MADGILTIILERKEELVCFRTFEKCDLYQRNVAGQRNEISVKIFKVIESRY